MVQTGLDILLHERLPLLQGRRVGVLCHPASVDAGLRHAVDALRGASVNITRLFGPEHGIRGEAQDMIGVDSTHDVRTGIPVTSLYGERFESLWPSPETLADIDVLLIDLQDVGSRYYTFIWTMALCLKSAAQAGVSVLVLDRPNPIGGHAVEGGYIEPSAESFVGLGSVPVRHGLTLGEVARLVRAGIPWGGERFAKPLDCDLQVLAMRGWRREDHFDATGLPWVLPSPNMPTPETALVYPGMCLLEATNISEGRGCTRPFEIFGAPFIDGYRLAESLASEHLPGVAFRPLSFRPTFHKFAGQVCGGVQLHVTSRGDFRPYLTGVAILRALRSLAGSAFAWRTEKYEFVSERPAIDLLSGGDQVRIGIEAGRSLADLRATWQAGEDDFRQRRRDCLIY
jgi:uncharacterized protein YbbC (DUF1343 family)